MNPNIQNNLKLFEVLGFEIIRSGENNITIYGYPVLLKETNFKEIFLPLTEDIAAVETVERIEEAIEKILATIACKSSLRAYDNISLKEMNLLLRQIQSTKNSGYCSHGRPVWRFMSIAELDRIFMRGR